MICNAALYCGLILGGITLHTTTEHAPSGGYTWINNDIGIEIEQSKEGFNLGAGAAYHKDSFNQDSFTAASRLGYRFNLNDGWELNPNAFISYHDFSYYEGPAGGFGVDTCKDVNNCIQVKAMPHWLIKAFSEIAAKRADGIVHINYKLRF